MDKKEIFPQILEKKAESGKASYEKKCIFHERILFHYLKRKMQGWSAGNFFDEENINSYALYAVTDFTDLLLDDLACRGNENILEIICDRKAEAFRSGYKGREVVTPYEMLCKYKNKKIKKIIIMSILHENEIIDELLEQGVLLEDIISFVSILYS